jgi:regulator of cell morphogenesis and NO signaling
MTNPATPPSPARRSLAELVIDDARAAAVLERFGLDYCCGGRRTLEEAAAERGLAPDVVVQALGSLGPPRNTDRLPAEWKDLDALTRHIVATHHRYVRDTTPVIAAWLDKLVARHGAGHPELAEVRAVFLELGDELMTHMAKEEHILFPFIEDLAAAHRAGARLPNGPFGTVLHPVRVMEEDHRLAGELIGRLRVLTRDHQPPEDACTTYRACYAELAAFEADLHRHIHLENNVLFPGALDLEQRLV